MSWRVTNVRWNWRPLRMLYMSVIVGSGILIFGWTVIPFILAGMVDIEFHESEGDE